MYPSEVFYGTEELPLTPKETRWAKKACGPCPVLRDCLVETLRNGEEWGVQAGMSRVDRLRLLKKVGGDWMLAVDLWEARDEN